MSVVHHFMVPCGSMTLITPQVLILILTAILSLMLIVVVCHCRPKTFTQQKTSYSMPSRPGRSNTSMRFEYLDLNPLATPGRRLRTAVLVVEINLSWTVLKMTHGVHATGSALLEQ